jgi:hypothetical protein
MFFIRDPYNYNLLNTCILQYSTLNLESTQFVSTFFNYILRKAAQMFKHSTFHPLIINFINYRAVPSLEPAISRECVSGSLRLINISIKH